MFEDLIRATTAMQVAALEWAKNIGDQEAIEAMRCCQKQLDKEITLIERQRKGI